MDINHLSNKLPLNLHTCKGCKPLKCNFVAAPTGMHGLCFITKQCLTNLGKLQTMITIQTMINQAAVPV